MFVRAFISNFVEINVICFFKSLAQHINSDFFPFPFTVYIYIFITFKIWDRLFSLFAKLFEKLTFFIL